MYRVIDEVSDTFIERNGRPLFCMEVETEAGARTVNSFGGHAQACGFTLHKKDVDAFLTLLKDISGKIPSDLFHYSYDIIDELPFEMLNHRLVKKLDKLLPYGQEFDFPIFYLKHCRLSKGTPFGNKYQVHRTPHVNFYVINAQESKTNSPYNKIRAVGFGLWEKYCKLKAQDTNGEFDLIFTIEMDHKRKKKKAREGVRLNVLDIRVTGDNVDGHLSQET